jgi:hypothetical protein
MLAGKHLKFNFEKCKAGFYRSFNAIYSKLGRINNPIVTLNLISSIAMPCLLYAVEALPINNATFKTLKQLWTRAFMKIFTTFNVGTVNKCQLHTGLMAVEHMIRLRKVNFMNSLVNSKNSTVQAVYGYAALQE